MTRPRHILVVAGLLGLSCLVQFVVIRRSVVPGLDAVRFVNIARSIDQQGLGQTLRRERQQPLFPAWVWMVHEVIQRVGGESRSAWATGVQLAAAIPLVLVVVPLYLLILRLVGAAAALAGTLFFCLLPEVSRLGADGISDSLHLLFFCVAFWAMVEYFRGQGSGVRGQGSGARLCLETRPSQSIGGGMPSRSVGMLRSSMATQATPCHPTASFQTGWLLLAGVATAMAVLARAEVLVLAGALSVALTAFQFLPGRRQAWRSLASGAGCFVLGLTVVLGPYLAAMGCATPRAVMGRILGRHWAEQEFLRPMATEAAACRMAGGEPMSFDAKEPSISLRRRGYPAAVARLGKKLADAFGYWIGALALLGAWCLSRGPANAAHRFVQVFFLLFSLAVIRFTAAEGYLVPRHLLPLVVVGIGSAGFGTLHLGGWIATRVGGRHQVSGRAAVAPLGWTLVVLAAAACLPQTLVRHHESRLGHRAAGKWLAAEADFAGVVLDTRGWSGLYSGRTTYPYEQAAAAWSDPHLAYVVMERRELEYDSGRSRTLRWLTATAAEPVAEFPHPATRRPNQQPVVVYRWYPDRFGRYVASRPANWQTREDHDAQVNRSVRR